MVNFVSEYPNVRVALNFHAFGPLFIVPFNFDSRSQNTMLRTEEQYSNAYQYYREIYEYAGVPDGYTFGNGATTIGYTANGEASDWMLHEKGIYAMSTELGINDKRSDTFFISNKEVLKDLC